MKLKAPEYYSDFKCIANNCRHNCCVGWEIDIDPDTLSAYQSLEGPFGDRIRSAIDTSGEDARFVLDANERCPFLNDCGLCDIIIQMGEEALCSICSYHPRFRNFFSDSTEIGLGMCCEEAAKIILSSDNYQLTVLEDDGNEDNHTPCEKEFFANRSVALSILSDKTKTFTKRIYDLEEKFGFSASGEVLCRFAQCFTLLEYMDNNWHLMINKLNSRQIETYLSSDSYFKDSDVCHRLLMYFMYRHLPDISSQYSFSQALAFCVLNLKMLLAVCALYGADSFQTFADVARRYSAEIEYSDENICMLMNTLVK